MRRLIPAHAGKTTGADGRPRGTWAHPRSRGENLMRCRTLVAASGSSPLTRGKRSCETFEERRGRLIPAHAGKTVYCQIPRRLPGAHPRSRGENCVRNATPQGVARLIPAHAGKTVKRPDSSPARPAHPRSRGENVEPRLPRADFAGSSPLTRGKPLMVSANVMPRRLIPAHAGKTIGRSCGPTLWPPVFPAHAGKTHASTPATRNLRAHPRSRGENALFSDFTRYVYGSSPLTRGKLSHQIKVALQVRLIPAHAGKTNGW